MPRGAGSYTRHAAAVEQRQAAAAEAFGPMADFFKLDNGQIAVVRFLEQQDDLSYASMHKIKVSNRQYPVDELCLDQHDDGTPCPFCLSEDSEVRSRRTVGFVNLIWRGNEVLQQINYQALQQNTMRQQQGLPNYMTYTLAPVFKRGQKGIPEKDQHTKQRIVIGYGDGVFLWKCSNTVYQALLQKDQTFGGLMSRDFTVRRQGSEMQDTVYYVEPYDANVGAVPMGPTDMALMAGKYDLDEFITPKKTFEEAQRILVGAVQAAPGQSFQRGQGVPQVLPPTMGALQQGVPMQGVPNPFPGGVPMQAPIAPPVSQ